MKTALPPAENLARFRWHTGVNPTPVAPDAAPPLLFRDIGPVAMAQFLSRGLRRLAGPMTPLTYLRTADYREPYIDHGRIGRLVVLRPMELHPWHSGLPHIYIAAAVRIPDAGVMGFVPGDLDLHEAARLLDGVQNANEAREAFAAADTFAAREEHLEHLSRLNAEAASTERLAQPLRVALQTGSTSTRERLSDIFAGHGLTESDLCAAWHHLAPGRRERLKEILPLLSEQLSR